MRDEYLFMTTLLNKPAQEIPERVLSHIDSRTVVMEVGIC